MNRDGYRDQIVTCDVDVSLHSKTHPLLIKYCNGTITQCYAYHYPSLFPVFFLQSLYVPFNSKNFSFTCILGDEMSYFVLRVLHVLCVSLCYIA